MYDAFRQALGRAILDPVFRQELLNNPDQSLRGFDLTPQERGILRQITPQQFDGLWKSVRSALRSEGYTPSPRKRG